MKEIEGNASLSWVKERREVRALAQFALNDLPTFPEEFEVEKVTRTKRGDLKFVIDRIMPLNDVLLDYLQFLYSLGIPNFLPARRYDVAIDEKLRSEWAFDDDKHVAEVIDRTKPFYLENDGTTILEYSDPSKEYFSACSDGKTIGITPLAPFIESYPAQRIVHAYGIFLSERQKRK